MKTLFGAIIVDGRNKLNGHVMSKNRYGSYMRTKVTPVNPQTSYQMAKRQQLGNTSSSWRGLTQDERNSWINAAPNFPTTDIFGNPKILSGQALFVGLNGNLLDQGLPIINTAPTPVAIPTISSDGFSATESTGIMLSTFTTTATSPDFALKVYATPNITPGRQFIKNRLRFLGTFDPSINPITFGGQWANRFGSLVAGQKVFIQVNLVSAITGQMGVPVQNFTVVVP
jgi:hypothetical protein